MRKVVINLFFGAASLVALPGLAGPPESRGDKSDLPFRGAMRERMFKEHDKDGDGKLSEDERKAARKAMHERMLKEFDKDGDGKLSLQELPQGARRSFQAQDDLDRDGQISAAELQAVMARMGGGARAWAAGMDPNRNQRVPPRSKP